MRELCNHIYFTNSFHLLSGSAMPPMKLQNTMTSEFLTENALRFVVPCFLRNLACNHLNVTLWFIITLYKVNMIMSCTISKGTAESRSQCMILYLFCYYKLRKYFSNVTIIFSHFPCSNPSHSTGEIY